MTRPSPNRADALKSLACGCAGVLTVVNPANATAAAAGTVTSAQASPGWLGHHAILGQIRQSGLWNVEHVTQPCDPDFLYALEQLIQQHR